MPISKTNFNAETWIVNRLFDRIHRRNQNVLVGFFGLPRKGKTYSAISLAEQVSRKLGLTPSLDDITFSVADRYGTEGMMARFNRNPPRGTAIGLDDAGTAAGANSRKWWSATNEALSTIGQSAGFLGYLFWVSAPESSDLDSQFRTLFHITFDVKRIDRDRKMVIAKPGVPYRDGKSGKVKSKYPRAQIPGLGPVRVKRVAFHLPAGANGPFNTWPEYEEKKAAFMRPLYVDLQRGLENPKRNPAWARRAVALLRESHPDWSQLELGDALGISQSAVAKLLIQAADEKRSAV
jgi:hypothetical protein